VTAHSRTGPRRKTSRTGEALAVGLVLLLAGGALWLDGRAPVPPPPRAAPGDAAAEAPFVERAALCPPSLEPFGGATALVAHPLEATPGAVAFEPGRRAHSGADAAGAVVERPPAGSPIDVVGYGAPVSAGAVAHSDKGSAAAPCATEASERWYFAGGSSMLGFDERLVISNPFPDEAVARVTFFTPSGAESKASLADVPVSAGEAVEVRINDFVLREPVLAAAVDALRGRLVAWKATLKDPREGVAGSALTLGASLPSDHWYMPAGAAGEGTHDRVSILNPGDEEAVVTVTLHTGSETIGPPDLTEVSVPPQSAMAVPLDGAPTKEEGGAGVVVESIGGAGVVVEHSTAYSAAERTGYSIEAGIPVAAKAWSIPPAALHPRQDDLVVLNPSSHRALVDISLVGEDGRVIAPARLSGIPLLSGTRQAVGLARWTRGKSVAVSLTSTHPTAAERVAYSAGVQDVSSTTGRPAP
jgi:Family of unknown function (DUF5719)